jgi:hypothetical protein
VGNDSLINLRGNNLVQESGRSCSTSSTPTSSTSPPCWPRRPTTEGFAGAGNGHRGMLTPPQSNSPVLDAAATAARTRTTPLATDQVGRQRIRRPDADVIARCDIGAIEFTGRRRLANSFE